MNEQIDLRSVSQRLFALSKLNRFSLQINNLAQAQALASDLLGITDSAGLFDFCLENDVDSLVETARSNGYLVLRDYDEGTKKLNYLELVAPGAQRVIRKIEPTPYAEVRSAIEAVPEIVPRSLNTALYEYRDSRLSLGNYRNRNILKMKDVAYSTGKRIIMSLGDAGIGHLQRAQNIIGQAASSGWAILSYDFSPDKDDFFGHFKRSIDSNRRNGDLIIQHHPKFEYEDIKDGAIFLSSCLKSKDSCHRVIFNGIPEMESFAHLIALLFNYCGQVNPSLNRQISWLDSFSSLDRVLGVIDDPKARIYVQDIKNTIFEFFNISSTTNFTYEQSEEYSLVWKKWVSPFIEMAQKQQTKASTCHVDFNEVIESRRILHAPVYLDVQGKHDLFNRAVLHSMEDALERVQRAKAQSLVVLRVSGSTMQHPLVMAMTRVFSAKGYQILMVIDGQTQKASLIAQKLAIVGKADCLWHTCHIKETSAMPYNLTKATAGQCLFVNKERIKEPLMLLPAL